MQADDTKCLQDVIEEVLEQIGIGEKQFQACLELYLGDDEKKPLIKEALDEAQVDRQEGVPPAERKADDQASMSKKEAIKAQECL